MWPFREKIQVEFEYTPPEFDGRFLSWNDDGVFLIVDLRECTAIGTLDYRLTFIHFGKREYIVPISISLLRSYFVAAKNNTSPISRQF